MFSYLPVDSGSCQLGVPYMLVESALPASFGRQRFFRDGSLTALVDSRPIVFNFIIKSIVILIKFFPPPAGARPSRPAFDS